MWLLAIQTAMAIPSNATPQIGVALLAGNGWGVELTGGAMASLGTGTRRHQWYPVFGGRGLVSWDTKRSFRVGVQGNAGAGALDMASVGFIPRFSVTADATFAYAVRGGAAFGVGGTLAKSLSRTQVLQVEPYRAVRQSGDLHALSVTAGVRRWWAGALDDAASPLQGDVGVRLSTTAGSTAL